MAYFLCITNGLVQHITVEESTSIQRVKKGVLIHYLHGLTISFTKVIKAKKMKKLNLQRM